MKEIVSKQPILQFNVGDAEIETIKSCYQGFFKLDEYLLRHKLFHGGSSELITREIFERGDAAVLMPYDAKNDLVVLQEQFRPGAMGRENSPWMLEFVAGMFGPNESPVEVAIREADEEAGLTISEENIEPIFKYFSSPGGTTEVIHLFVGHVDASNVGGIYGLEEEAEDILVHVVSRTQALDLLAQGKILNAATIIGLQWLALNYQTLQAKWLA